jgi:hypothetical protein
MRSLNKISIVATLALFVATGSIPLAQPADEATELSTKVQELYIAGRYSDAIPIAQRALAIREKALGRASSSDPKLSHAEALRQSMLAMIDAARSDDEANPRFWAPFVVVGEPAKPQ